MVTPVEVKPTFTNIDMNSRTGANSPIDPVRVSAEAPAPDIVERLRNGEPDEHCNDSLCAEAADTITALTAEVERLREELDTWKSVFPDIAPASVLPDRSLLEAENERLRAALETVRDEYGYTFPTDTNQMIAAALKEPRT
jgi:hypothetical protein